jgi:cytochrome c oxidase assembly protein subunit 15
MLALAMLALQLVYGALLAGLRGRGGRGGLVLVGCLAADAGQYLPRWRGLGGGAFHALTSDPYLVHFFHRWWAWAVVAVLVVIARKLRRARQRRFRWPSLRLWHAGRAGHRHGLERGGDRLAVLHQLCGAVLLALHGVGGPCAGKPGADKTRRQDGTKLRRYYFTSPQRRGLLDSWGHLQQRRGSSPRVCQVFWCLMG